jgi:peptide/nickel transport system substrate-binding protein
VKLGVAANHVAFQPNQTTKDDKLREFFQNRDVRIALSYAINRQEMNDLIFNGTATPRQYSPLKESPQYYEKLSNAYIEYDVAKANELLDKAGYDKKDGEGFRLWKDGSGTLSFTVESIYTTGDPFEDAAQTTIKYFAAVGVKCAYKGVERALYTEHYNANEIESAFWGGDHAAAAERAAGVHGHHDRSPVGRGLGPVAQQPEGSQRPRAGERPLHQKDLGDLGQAQRRTGRGQAQRAV